jgi:hypothetical protein
LRDRWFLKVEPPELKSRFWRLSAVFSDVDEEAVCVIDRNELILPVDNWGMLDFEQQATRFKVLWADRVIADFEIDPPRRLVINKMICKAGRELILVDRDSIDLPQMTARIEGIDCKNSGINSPS